MSPGRNTETAQLWLNLAKDLKGNKKSFYRLARSKREE